jgi:hypothetical protein
VQSSRMPKSVVGQFEYGSRRAGIRSVAPKLMGASAGGGVIVFSIFLFTWNCWAYSGLSGFVPISNSAGGTASDLRGCELIAITTVSASSSFGLGSPSRKIPIAANARWIEAAWGGGWSRSFTKIHAPGRSQARIPPKLLGGSDKVNPDFPNASLIDFAKSFASVESRTEDTTEIGPFGPDCKRFTISDCWSGVSVLGAWSFVSSNSACLARSIASAASFSREAIWAWSYKFSFFNSSDFTLRTMISLFCRPPICESISNINTVNNVSTPRQRYVVRVCA